MRAARMQRRMALMLLLPLLALHAALQLLLAYAQLREHGLQAARSLLLLELLHCERRFWRLYRGGRVGGCERFGAVDAADGFQVLGRLLGRSSGCSWRRGGQCCLRVLGVGRGRSKRYAGPFIRPRFKVCDRRDVGA